MKFFLNKALFWVNLSHSFCSTSTVFDKVAVGFNIFQVNKKHPNRSYTLWMSTTHSKNSIFCQHYNDNIPSALLCKAFNDFVLFM